MESASVQTRSSRRLLAPDLARGLMLLLIAMAYAGVYAGSGFGVDASDEPAVDRGTSLMATLFLDNRAFPLFAILFGYGLAWSVDRRTRQGVKSGELRDRTKRRALLLLLFGAIHAFLVFPGEILTSYGLALLLTGWLLFRSDRALNVALVITAGFTVFMVPLIMMAAAVGPGDGFSQVVPGYTSSGEWIDRLTSVVVGPLYVAVAYPLLFLVILGYRAGRARLFEDTASHRELLRLVALVGISVSVVGAIPSGLVIVGAIEPAPPVTGLLMGLQVLTGVVGGAGYAALFALGAERLDIAWPSATRAIAAMGKRSLTVYILNSILVALVLHPDLIGVGAHVGHFGALVAAFLAWILSLVVASALEHAGRSGPLETLMRRALEVGG